MRAARDPGAMTWMDSKPRPPPKAPGGKPPAQSGGPEAAFDLWLNERLHQLYDSVAQEPLPPELLQLIEADRQRRDG